jgi:hypothetical protein
LSLTQKLGKRGRFAKVSELHYEVEEDGLDNPGSKLSAAVKSII